MELIFDDLHFLVERLPKDLRKMMKSNPLYLGGGCIRALVAGEKISDYDLFGSSAEDLQRWATELAEKRKGRVYKTGNACTVLAPPRIPIQFITRWLYGTPQAIIDGFDFTICQGVVWWAPNPSDPEGKAGQWRSLVSPSFYPDLAARRLRYTSPIRDEEAGGSMLRVIKYMRRGYGISPSSLGKVIARVANSVDWERVAAAENPEEFLSQVIVGLLREVDPLTVIDGLEVLDPLEGREIGG